MEATATLYLSNLDTPFSTAEPSTVKGGCWFTFKVKIKRNVDCLAAANKRAAGMLEAVCYSFALGRLGNCLGCQNKATSI